MGEKEEMIDCKKKKVSVGNIQRRMQIHFCWQLSKNANTEKGSNAGGRVGWGIMKGFLEE